MKTRRNTLRIAAALLAVMLLLTACGTKPAAPEPAPQIANPVSEVTSEEMTQKTGVALNAPEGAENVCFYTIDGQPMIAQVTFELDGAAYTYRAAATQMDATALSGVYFGKADEAPAQVSYTEGKLLTEGKTAVLYWEDVVPGVSYSLSCTDCADPAALQQIAETVFEPMQGEVDGK